jgi:type 1 glutamine amidotransferase
MAAAGCSGEGGNQTPAVEVAPATAAAPIATPGRILVFTRTTGFRHDSIPTAVALLRSLAAESGLQVEHSEDAALFRDETLRRYRAVVFASTTGNILDPAQRAALQRFVRGGGGFLGVHAAADTEDSSSWYGDLIVARFASHPPGLQTTHVRFEGSGSDDAAPWRVTDELYNYDRNPRAHARVIATVDEADYDGGTMGADHPIAWCHERFGGRSWYTGLGHDNALYADATYRRHLLGGLRYVVGLAATC